MSKLFFMFPGQGSQAKGMVQDLYEKEALVKDIFNQASESCGIDIAKLCFDTQEDELKKTENAQPAIFVASYAIASVLREKGKTPDIVAGHSLGEYTAVTVAGMLSFRDACKLIKLRGTLMAKAGQNTKGTMAAIIGLPDNKVDDVCKKGSEQGIVVPANYNSPGQVVISGEIEAVQKAMEIAKTSGAKRAIELQVSGAFHSPLIAEVKSEFQKALDDARFMDSSIPVISNVTANPVTNGKEMKDLLLKQLVSPVRWVASINKVMELGADTAVEVGNGKVLTGLLRKISRELKSYSVSDTNSVNNFINEK